MASRSWMTSICTAVGVAAGAGAAQLGCGYGLGIITWAPVAEKDASRALWFASLTWVVWIAANSTVLGALCSDRLGDGNARSLPAVADGTSDSGDEPVSSLLADTAWRAVIALAAATGALIVVPLVAIPARLAPPVSNSAPQYTVGGYAIAGIIMGIVVALGALHARAIAANIIAFASWTWLLAVAAVIRGLQVDSGAGAAQLATWHFDGGRMLRGTVNLPGALLMLGVTLLIAPLAAVRAGRRGDSRVGVAISGAVGPMMVAAAYLLAAPGVKGTEEQISAYVMAPYAVLAGLAGSVLISALGQKGSRARAKAERESREACEAAALQRWQQSLTGDGTFPDDATFPGDGAFPGDGSPEDTVAGGDTLADAGGRTASGRTSRAKPAAGRSSAFSTTTKSTGRRSTARGTASTEPTTHSSANDESTARGTASNESTARRSASDESSARGTASDASSARRSASDESTGRRSFTRSSASAESADRGSASANSGEEAQPRKRSRTSFLGRASSLGRTNEDLEDDAYAPSRAYSPQPEAGGQSTTSSTLGTDESTIPKPLWPDHDQQSNPERKTGRTRKRR